MSRIRIYELAREAGMGSKQLADKLIAKGYDIKGHSSTVDEETAKKIRKMVLSGEVTQAQVEKTKEDVAEKKPTAVRRRTVIRRKAKPQPEPEVIEPEITKSQEDSQKNESEKESKDNKILDEAISAKKTLIKKESTSDNEEKIPETIKEDAVSSDKEKEQKLTTDSKQKKEVKEVKKKKPAKKTVRSGAAKIIGTVEIPIEEKKTQAKPRKKPTKKPKNKRSSVESVKNNIPKKDSATPSTESGRKERGGKFTKPEAEIRSEKGKGKGKGKGKKFAKKGRDKGKVQFTRFGESYDRSGGRGGKKGKKSRKAAKVVRPAAEMKASKKRVKIFDTISVGDLASGMKVKASEVIAKLMELGVMATMNQALDFETATLIATDFDYTVEQGMTEELGVASLDESESGGKAILRDPVVTVMGHVDHGKTSILDAIRKTDVAEGEAGGITQHIGAYHVRSNVGNVTFVDTPGHAAFTEMRARGAKITDIVVLVVAADDSVMDQTREAIRHSQAADVPIIVAVNKIDKENADIERVKRELAELDLAPEEWGGDTIFCETSAKRNQGIEELVENIHLLAEILELTADPERKAKGRVVEAQLDKGRGPVGTILVQQGTLRVGDNFVAGLYSGKVRAMSDERGGVVTSAGPSIPVEIHGLSGVPSAGDEFVVVSDEKMAKSVSQVRMLKSRESDLASSTKISLDKLFEKMAEGDIKELPLILRSDVQGTLEAFGKAAEKLSTDEVKVKIIHEGTGTITESDVLLASASEAIIIGFNVRPSIKVKEIAARESVDLRFYDVIYHALDDITAAMAGMLDPVLEEEVIGNVEVRETFNVPKIGTIAGCFVTDGKITRNSSVRVVRDGVVVYTGKVGSLRRFKDDAKEVGLGYECGVGIEKYNDLKVGDNLEAFIVNEVEATL